MYSHTHELKETSLRVINSIIWENSQIYCQKFNTEFNKKGIRIYTKVANLWNIHITVIDI